MKSRVRCKKGATVEDRLRLHMIEAPSGCWVWTGARSAAHYGRFLLDGKTRYAHRVSYETFVGPIPDGLQLDHLCRYPACINPRHLQPVTPRVNMLRGTSPAARSQRRESCIRGHAYADYSYFNSGRRFCRECMRMHRARYAAATAAQTEQRRVVHRSVIDRLIAIRDGQVSA